MMNHIYLIGDPVEHSISPQMHNSAYKALGLTEHQYEAVRVFESDLKSITDKYRSSDVAGFNVTVPHKENIIKYLDELDPYAKTIGAVNAVVNLNGKLKGYNTDALGFIQSLGMDGSFNLSGNRPKKAIIIGAGGASKAVIATLLEKKMGISLFDIDFKKAQALSGNITLIKDKDELERRVLDGDLLINATPVGMYPKIDAMPISESALHSKLFVFDLVYNPSQTKLVKAVIEKGGRGINGLGMLVRQGAAGFELFTGKKAPLDLMWQAAKGALLT